MAHRLSRLVEELSEAHGENLKSVVLYGSAALDEQADEEGPHNIVVVLDKITPDELRAAHAVTENWRSQGNPPPVYFTSQEITDSSDVFPIEFLDMSRARRVLFGQDPFEGLEIPTYNLRHQLEYELRGKLLRLRTLYIPASQNPNRLARLMADSLESFAVLFRHVLEMLGVEAPSNKRDSIMRLADVLGLDKKVLNRIYDYADDEELWLQAETNETFASYLMLIERVIKAVDEQRS